MRLTSFTDYALRLLIYCALRPDALVTIADVSRAYGISKSHLMKIANELSRAGFIHAVRGRNGGLRLARPARAINIGNVVRVMERESLLVECFDRTSNTCVIAPACGLKHLLAQAAEDFCQRLETATLADITKSPRSIRSLLLATEPT